MCSFKLSVWVATHAESMGMRLPYFDAHVCGASMAMGSARYSVYVACRNTDVTKQYTHVSNGETLY